MNLRDRRLHPKFLPRVWVLSKIFPPPMSLSKIFPPKGFIQKFPSGVDSVQNFFLRSKFLLRIPQMNRHLADPSIPPLMPLLRKNLSLLNSNFFNTTTGDRGRASSMKYCTVVRCRQIYPQKIDFRLNYCLTA